jgi:hypothetical protein
MTGLSRGSRTGSGGQANLSVLEATMSPTTTLPVKPGAATVQAITDRLRHLADVDPNRCAIIDQDRAITIGQLGLLARQLAGGRPPARGAVVPIPAHPVVGTIAEAFAVWLGGGVPLPVPLGVRARTVETAIALAATNSHRCRPWRAHLHSEYGGRHVWVAGGEPPDAPRVGDAIGLTRGGTALVAAPLHAAAVFEATVRQLLAGGTVVFRPDFTPDGWLHTAATTGADWAVLAPGQIKALLRWQQQQPGRLAAATRALAHVVVPATVPQYVTGPIPDFAAAAGVAVTTWYHAPAYDGATAGAHGAGGLAPLPGLRLRTVDPAGRPVRPGVAGLVEAASAGCGAVAHRADQPCPPATGWRTSGDVGALDGDGRLILHRIEAVEHYLTPAGQRVRVTALRRIIALHPHVAAVAIHVVPDDHGRARAQLRVWPRPGAAFTAAAVAAYCARYDTAVSAEHVLVMTTDPPAGGAREHRPVVTPA